MNKDRFVTPDKDPYREHIGLPVEISDQHGASYGIYKGLTLEKEIVLSPFLMEEFKLMPGTNENGRETRRKRFVWTDRPAFFNYQGAIIGVLPISKEYLEEMVKEGPPQILVKGKS